jgi:hypothetical protein
MKLMPTEFLHSIEIEARTAVLNIELYSKARQAGLQIFEVGIPHHPRRAGQPRGARPRAVASAIRELIVFRAKCASSRRGLATHLP